MNLKNKLDKIENGRRPEIPVIVVLKYEGDKRKPTEAERQAAIKKAEKTSSPIALIDYTESYP